MNILFILWLLVMWSWIFLQFYIHKMFSKWNEYQLNISGWDLLEQIKRDRWIPITINPIEWTLSDHYMPSTKEINLSNEVFYWKWVSSIAVALHEFWHSLQHNDNSILSRIHSFFFPIMKISSIGSIWLFLVWIFLNNSPLVWFSLIFFWIVSLYYLMLSFLEYDASKRWYELFLEYFKWVDNKWKLLFKQMLFVAFLTYFLSFLQSIIQFMDAFLKWKDMNR